MAQAHLKCRQPNNRVDACNTCSTIPFTTFACLLYPFGTVCFYFCRLVLCALRLSSLDPHFTDLCLWILTRVRPFPSPSLFVLVCLSHFTHFPFSLSNFLSFSLYLFIVCSLCSSFVHLHFTVCS
jgi:hypothetical protein